MVKRFKEYDVVLNKKTGKVGTIVWVYNNPPHEKGANLEQHYEVHYSEKSKAWRDYEFNDNVVYTEHSELESL